MSWFSELAVKAESLLEKVDNTAANVLTKEEQQGYFRNIPLDVPESGDEGVSQPPADLSSSSTRVKDTSQIGPSAPTRPRLPVSTPRQPPPKPREKTDDLLFEFLNSNAPSAKEKKRSSLDSPNSIRKSIESPSQTSIDSRDGDEHVVTETSKSLKPKEDSIQEAITAVLEFIYTNNANVIENNIQNQSIR